MIPGVGNFTGLRAVRALRPLRTLKYVRGMPVLVSTILQAIGQLGSVMAILGFVMIIFGILGQGMFQGVLHYRCMGPPYARRMLAGQAAHPPLSVFNGTQGLLDGSVAQLLQESLFMDEGGEALRWYDEGAKEPLAASGRLLKGSSGYQSNSYRSLPPSPPPEGSALPWDLFHADASAGPCKARRRGRALKGGGGGGSSGGGGGDECDCAESEDGGRRRRRRLRHGRTLKGGGGGGGGGKGGGCGPDLEGAPFCNPADPNACAAVPGTACTYFAEPSTLNDFDSVMNAVMAISQIVTLDTWSQSMYDVMQAFSPHVWIYFVVCVLISGFFIVNLFLGVVFDEFMRAKATETATEELAKLSSAANVPRKEASDDGRRKPGGKESPTAVDGFHELEEEADGSGVPKGAKAVDGGGFRCLKPIVDSHAFHIFSYTFLIINIVLMCLPSAQMHESRVDLLHSFSRAFSLIFIIEICTSVLAAGPQAYFSDGWNRMEFFLVLTSGTDIALTYTLGEGGINLNALRGLRLLRVLRIVRLVHYWKGVYKIFAALIGAGPQIANIFVLLFVFMTVFALMGMQLFAGQCGSEDGNRYHFDYYVPAMLVVLIVFSGGWVDAYESCLSAGVVTTRLYFGLALLIGFFIIMNLFVAILLESLADDETEEEEDDAGGEAAPSDGEEGGDKVGSATASATAPNAASNHPLRGLSRAMLQHPLVDATILLAIGASCITLAVDTPYLDPNSDLAHQLKEANYLFTALFVSEAALRILAYDVLDPERGYFTQPFNVLDFFIVLGSIISLYPGMGELVILRILRVLRPMRLLSRVPGMKVIFDFLIESSGEIFDVVGVVTFCHVLFAVVGMELFMGSFGSCTDPSITLKEFCVDTTAPVAPQKSPQGADYSYSYDSSANTHSHRLLALADSRLDFNRLASMLHEQDASSLWLASAEDVDSVATDEATSNVPGQFGEAAATRRRTERRRGAMDMPSTPGRNLKGGGGGGGDQSDLPVAWLNPPWGSFDDFPSAMMVLFIAATADGWDLFMFQGMDAVGRDLAPVRNDYSPASLYFICWLVLGCFTMINLFVGAVCDNFSRIKEESEGSGFSTLTDEQKQWVRTKREGFFLKERVKTEGTPLDPPSNTIQRAFFMLVNSEGFDNMLTIIIFLNVGVMACDYHGMQDDEEIYYYFTTVNHYFRTIYYAECVLKIVGLGFRGYFATNWNRFDFFLVWMTLIDTYFADILDEYLPVPPMFLRVMRVARVMRILRLLKRFKRLRDLIKTAILSFPSLINIGALLSVVTFIYAVVGVQLFWNLKPGLELNEQRNFHNIGSTCLLLFQCLTGDGWSTLMSDAAIGPERGCDPDAVPTDCGDKNTSVLYFLSYMFIGTFVLLNLIVAVILEHFTALGSVNPDLVSASDITDLGELWGQIWLERIGMMTAGGAEPPSLNELDEQSLASLLLQAAPPLGTAGIGGEEAARSLIRELRLQFDDDGYVDFKQVIDAMVRRGFDGIPPPQVKDNDFDDELDYQAHQHARQVQKPPPLATPARRLPESAPRPRPTPSAPTTRDSSLPASEARRLPEPAPLPPPITDGRSMYTPSPHSEYMLTRPLAASPMPFSPHESSCAHDYTMQSPPQPPPGSLPQLPRHWSIANTPRGPYYYNWHTRQVSWQPPLEWLEGSAYAQSPGSPIPSHTTGPPPRPPPGTPPPLPDRWRRVHTPRGTYYYDIETREVQWKPPADWLYNHRRIRNDGGKKGGYDVWRNEYSYQRLASGGRPRGNVDLHARMSRSPAYSRSPGYGYHIRESPTSSNIHADYADYADGSGFRNECERSGQSSSDQGRSRRPGWDA